MRSVPSVPASTSLRMSEAHARLRGHPFDLGFALTAGARAFDYRREPDALLKRLDEASELGRQNSLPVFADVLVPLFSLSALILLSHKIFYEVLCCV